MGYDRLNTLGYPLLTKQKITANHNPFLGQTRFSNAARGGSIIYRNKKLWKTSL